ncbi:MAG: insulinase family protein [Marinobacterium sp.]|nr:insulinase family protein [Marinobacterium sp.]
MHLSLHLKRLRTLFAFILMSLGSLVHASVHKSPNDHRDYQGFTLDNKLRVLVISDPNTQKAAASLDVGTGSGANPEDRAGLAHFLEHMLFLGTEKYPQAGEYKAFISSGGGTHNAYTAYENTNYFFDIRADLLGGALDRFSQFFISPLFTEEYVDRERHAVYSEYQSKLRDDSRRIFEATKQTTNPAHSFSRFFVGSLKTLADRPDSKVRDDLLAFYERYYSANLMTLVVLGKEPVDELRKMVEARFAAIPNTHAEPFVNNVPLMQPDSLPARLSVRSIKDIRTLSLTFPVDAVREHWRSKPLRYIASQLGYEGKGSLLADLKARGWANGLGAYTSTDMENEAALSVEVSLTPEGMNHQQEITQLFFHTVELLKKEGIDKSLYDEERQQMATRFQFAEKQEPIHYVGQLARAMQKYPLENVVDAPYLFEQFDPALIRSYLNQLSADNMLVTVVSKDQQTDRKGPNFKVDYRLEKLRNGDVAAATETAPQNELAVRDANPFIAADLSLKPLRDQAEKPEVILRKEGVTLWHLQDSEFRTPKADLFFTILSNPANITPQNSVLTSLYSRMVQDQLNETLYDAAMAGLSTRIYPHMRGISVRISGYNDKQTLLLEQVVSALSKPHFNPERFEIIKTQYARQLANSRRDKPFNQTIGEIMQLLLPQWSLAQREQALADVTLQDLNNFVPVLLKETELRVLAHGNLLQENAVKLTQVIENGLFAEHGHKRLASTQVLQLPEDSRLVQTLNVDHNDSAISVYFQGSDSELKTRAQYALLSEMIASPFYTRLRTEQQLGYVVFQTLLPLRRAPGLAFVVQSPVANPVELESRIDSFLEQMRADIASMDETTLERFKKSLVSRLLKPENGLTERSNRYWTQIDTGDANFDGREALADAVNALQLSDLLDCYTQLPERRLTVRSFGQKHLQTASAADIALKCDTEINALKQNKAFMPGA